MKSYTILDFADDSEEALNEVRKLYPNVTVESVDKEPGQVKISGDRV